MASFRMVLAAVGGLAAAFLIVMLFEVAAPDRGLGTGEVEAPFEGFQFVAPELTVTRGSIIEVVNRDAVAVPFVVEAPGGERLAHVVAPGSSWTVTLAEEGAYAVTSSAYAWVDATWHVRSANPITRFFEDFGR